MSGIPVHFSSPINANAAKATGITPTTTALHGTMERSEPASNPTSTTATTAAYPPAQPGAAPGPAPTGLPQPPATMPPTRTAPPTHSQTSHNPPPPQPGAVPSPFTAGAQRSSIPPPPKAHEIPRAAAYYEPQFEEEQRPPASQYSPHIAAPPPLSLQPHQQSATLLSTPNRSIPPSGTTASSNDLSHPPGYIQDSLASFNDRAIPAYRPFENTSFPKSSKSRQDGLLNNDRSAGYEQGDNSLGQIWDTAKSWAKTAGEKLKEGEEEVWRRVNGEK